MLKHIKRLAVISNLLLSIFGSVQRSHAASPIQPDQLSCEYLKNPLGIDSKAPRFNWTMSSTGRNHLQSAYEIIVSSKLNEAQQLKGNIWSTGKITSNQNIHIEYKGAPLQSFTRYFWRVRVYDEKGEPSAWSAVNFFETAMLQQQDWKAKWIGDGSKQPVKDEDYYKEDPMPL